MKYNPSMKKLLLLLILSVGVTNLSYAITSEEICKGEHSLSLEDKKLILKQRGVLCNVFGNVLTIKNTGNLNVKIPDNARSSNTPLGWKCNKDFRQIDASKCIPDMSDSDSSSMGWKCKPGFTIYQTVTGAKNCKSIKKLKIPQNAFASGDKWFCKSGYKTVGNKCFINEADSGTLIAYGYLSNLPMCKGSQDSYRNKCVGAYKWTGGDTDGWEYYGEWKANKRHGVGIFYFKNPDEEYFGESINDAFSGSGIMTYPDGAVWAGVWKNDRVNGLGIFVEDGFMEEGLYKDGNFQSFKKYLPKNATQTKPIEGSAHTSWNCNYGYYRIKNYICLKSNSKASTSSENISEIPKNAKATGNGWTCNTNYYKKTSSSKTCSRVPQNSTSSSLSNSFKCNKDYKKSANKCIPKIVIPKNAKASGSSFMCNSGYYKNSSTTGCLKVPAYAKKLSNDKGWSCSSGYTKTGKTCTNSAELKRIQEAKKIAQAKAAKVRKAAQLEAQNYYNDLETFLKTNTKEYDTRKILELRKQNKVILTEPWDQVLEKNFAELKSFTATSKAFRDYHQLRNDARQRAVLNELDKANTRLKNIEAYLNYYVDNNLTSDIALDVLDQIDIAAAGLKKQSLDELSAVSMQLESFIAKNKLANNFKAFSKALAKITPDEPEVVVQKIDATDLVNFDFMKKANRDQTTSLLLTSPAKHRMRCWI